MAIVEDADGRRYAAPLTQDPDGSVRRARPGDGAALALIAALATREGAGEVSDHGFTLSAWHHRALSDERPIDVDQSNESVIVQGRDVGAVVKWVVRVSDAGDPAPERVSRLVAAGFEAMPKPWGMVQWQGDGGSPPALVAMITELVPGARDGWEWAVAEAKGYAVGGSSLEATAIGTGRALGRIVAEMHLGLAADRPPRADAVRARQWHEEALTGLAGAVRLVDGGEGERLARRAPAIRHGLAALGEAAGTPLVPIHGDLHVGQVLLGDDGALRITDFDGNPVASAHERNAPQPAAADVAGMAQSLDHVAYVVLHRTPGVDTDAVWRWRDAVVDAFLSTYREVLDAAGRRDLLDERLVEPLRLRQVCREYVYAARHLPHWRFVPDHAVRERYTDDAPTTPREEGPTR